MVDQNYVPSTFWLKFTLLGITLSYFTLGAYGCYLVYHKSRSWDGTSDTLTSILAVSSAILGVYKSTLESNCKQAGLGDLAKKAIRGSITINELNERDAATRGSFAESTLIGGLWGKWYSILLPGLELLMSATLKKSIMSGYYPVEFPVNTMDAALDSPTNINNLLRGSAWSGAILYNTCLLYTSPSPRDGLLSRMPSSA